ncbi:MAG: AzlC family ABC transporter permease [Deltaproteobacteria bacterium]|nr:AzlC family ABC transporter permease [Deltaproteobacteria bacterium]
MGELFPGRRAGRRPLLLGIVPFGLINGAAASEAGLSLLETVGMSLFVFAGAAQLAFVELWGQGAAGPALALACLALNLRLMIFGASVRQALGPPSSLGAAGLRSCLPTDESYAVSMVGYARPGFARRKVPYYLGAGLPTWLGWQSAGLVGHLTGSLIPSSWPLGMAVPLIFMALLISILRTPSPGRSPRWPAAAASGLTAAPLRDLPFNLGLIAAVAVGVAAGLAVDGRRRASRPLSGPQ